MNTPSVHVGIDIAKDSFQFHIHPKLAGSLPNAPAGFKRLERLLQTLKPPLHLVCEASGGFEQPLVEFFLDQGRLLSVVDPARVRHFIRGLGQRAKTDPIDAQMLARVCPTGMIFVPSVNGLSHNPAEYTSPTDLEAGANVLLQVMLELAAT